MTDQLERDLTELFARKAEETEAPPIPAGLLTGAPDDAGADSRRHRRTIAIGLVAAAAVAAVAVPVGIALRDKGDGPSPAPQPDAPHSLDIPYLRDGALHVDGLTLPTTGSSLVVAGSGVLVASAEEEGRGLTWERLDGDSLQSVPWLDGYYGAVVSYDGRLVAAPVGSGGAASVQIWDATTGDEVDTIELASVPSAEDPWLRGFDGEGRLFWEDGGIRMRTADGAEVDVRAPGFLLASIAPGGLVLREGDADTAVLGQVTDGGQVREAATDVPVSTVAAWSESGELAYVPIGDGRVFVTTPGTGATPVALPAGQGTLQPVGWTGGRVVLVDFAVDPGEGNRVLLVDPTTKDVEEVFGFGADEQYPFASTEGTGAL